MNRFPRYRFVFGLIFLFSLHSCAAAPRSEPDFYEGLKKKNFQTEDGGTSDAVAHFVKALDNSNPYIAAAASAELMILYTEGTAIPATAMPKIRQKAGSAGVVGSWAQAFDALGDGSGKPLAFLLSGGRDRFRDEAGLYVAKQRGGGQAGIQFTEKENAAVDGRIAVSRSRYNEALVFFRIVLGDSPELFLQYPDLLADLGRAFQYAATGNEGINLFLEWEKTVSEDDGFVRYLLLFYSGRIARQRGDRETSMELFARALPFAPETPAEQADSCIWYILDSALAAGPDTAVSLFETYIPLWRDDTYFFDVTDKLTRELILSRRWNDILRLFELAGNHSGAITAKYAWIIGRAIEEGLLSAEETRRAEELVPAALSAGQTVAEGNLGPAGPRCGMAEAYKRVAWNESGGAGMKVLYYRSLSATALGEPFLVLPDEPLARTSSAKMTAEPSARRSSAHRRSTRRPQVAARNGESERLKFLLGFFEHGVADFAPRYIRMEENNLSADELRRLAEALGAAGQNQESMRLVSLYTKRDGYQIGRADLELSYPRPFKELVEQYASETEIEPALLFGLIRTESAFDSNAVSRAGAIGLTQLMPATAEEAANRIRRQGGPDYTRINIDEDGIETSDIDLRDPAANIHIGASYLAFLNGRMEDPLLALLAYNGGMNRVRRWRTTTSAAGRLAAGTLPPDLFLETVEITETMDYGRSVTAAAAVYRALYYGE